MKNYDLNGGDKLRRRAEESLQGTVDPVCDKLSTTEMHRLMHELQVYQVELKIQNEDLRDSQAELETALARYADFYDFAPSGFISLNSDGEILQTNLPGARMLGTERARLIGQPLARFIVHNHRDRFRECLAKLFECRSREACNFDLIDTDRERVSVQFEGALSADCLEARAVMVDISEQKRASTEREKLQEQLFLSKKMDSVGQLAGGVAHDFNNSLAAILGYAELALQELAPDHPVARELREIRKAADHSAALVGQLLAFARQQTIVPRLVDLNATVDQTLNMVRRLIGESIDLIWRPAASLWPVRMDPNQIDQIIVNLCVNARDAMKGTGSVTIESANISLDETDAARFPETTGAAGDFVMLTVQDTGHGIRPQDRARIFDPFYTTKELGEGTGLGLATVYGIVKQNDGFIGVESEDGQGTTFRILLPRYCEADLELPVESAAEPREHGSETILVVEDELAVLNLTRRILESLGYRVLATESPDEAMRIARAYAAEIRLVISDVVMPEMNGRDLVVHLREEIPGLKHLFMSGYTADIIADHGVLDQGIQFIQKPFRTDDLARHVREALEA